MGYLIKLRLVFWEPPGLLALRSIKCTTGQKLPEGAIPDELSTDKGNLLREA